MTPKWIGCSQCHISKPFTDFYRDKSSKDGRVAACKKCTNKYTVAYYHRHRDKRNLYSRSYYEKNKKQILKRIKVYKKRNPEKWKARQDVRNAVTQGKLIKPLVCDDSSISSPCFGKLEGHHDDYSKPLKVRWLCVKHHKLLHRKHKQYA